MNSDSLLAIGAIVLFSILVVYTYSNIISTAVDLSESLMMEIVSKNFDENSINATPNISGLSSTLGPDGETYPNYNDIDDYNGYKVNIKTKYSDSFTSIVKVQYVNTNNFTPSSTQTGMKEITVSTYSPSLVDTVKINYYSSYIE